MNSDKNYSILKGYTNPSALDLLRNITSHIINI